MTTESPSRDFFISFNRADREWASWIAWVLEDAGYKVYFQDWDFGPGVNFMAEMQRAVIHSGQTVLVLSDDALRSDFVTAEWTAAMAADPSGARRKVIPVRVKHLTLPRGLLGQIVYVDLVDLSPSDARSALLGALGKRRKPSAKPPFPTRPASPAAVGIDLGDRLRQRRDEVRERQDTEPDRPATDRSELTKSLAKLGVRYFNILLEALEAPSGAVPAMPAAQRERIGALLDWAEGERSGLSVVAELMELVQTAPATSIPLDQLEPDRLALAAIDSCDGVLREVDLLGRAYIQVEQWPKAFLVYSTLVELAAEEDTRLYARGLARLGEVHWQYGERANAERSWKSSRDVYSSLNRDGVAVEEARQMARLEEALVGHPAGEPKPDAD